MLFNKTFYQKYFDLIFILILSLSFFIIRITTVYDNAAGYDFADTNSYFVFTLSEPIRMPLITFLFSTIKYFGAITLAHAVISSLVWIILGLSIFRFLPKFKILGFVLTLLLGVSTPVVELDTLLLSESLTLSFLVLSVATLLLYLINPKKSLLLGHVASVFLFSQMKQSTLLIGTLWLLIFLLFIYKKSFTKKVNFLNHILFFVVFCLNILAWNISSNNAIHDRQLSTTLIIEKAFFSDELRNYWLEQGFPAEAFTVYGGPPFDIPIQSVRKLHSIKLWENNTETNPSFRLIQNRPLYALVAPVAPGVYIDNYGYINSILPALASGTDYVENQEFRDGRYPDQKTKWITNWNLPKTFFWSNNFINQKIILVALFMNLVLFMLFTLSKSRNQNDSSTALMYISLLFLSAVWANWLLTAYNYERYLIPYSVGLRIIAIVTFCLNLWMVQNYLNKKFKEKKSTMPN
jgi:hypothetical protein